MSKPICHSECDWIFWRDDMPMRKTKLRTHWRKKLMVRARRRYYKEIDKAEVVNAWRVRKLGLGG